MTKPNVNDDSIIYSLWAPASLLVFKSEGTALNQSRQTGGRCGLFVLHRVLHLN